MASSSTSRDRTRLPTAASLLSALVLFGSASTGCQAGLGNACKGDSDCRSDQICAAGSCTLTCDGDDDCERSGFTCQPFRDPRTGNVINACQTQELDAGNGGSFQCRTDQECRDRLEDDRAECGIAQTCLIRPERHVGVHLRDRTEVGDPPSPGPDGGLGADIAAVLVTGPDGDAEEARGFGKTLRYEPARGAGDASHLTGSPPALDGSGRCLEGAREDVTTVLGGEGGVLTVELVDREGRPIRLRASDQIVVIEWGANCGVESGEPDRFSADLCASNGEPAFDPQTDCRKRLGRGTGYHAFPVSRRDEQ